MKIKIKLGDMYSQQLLSDSAFRSMFIKTINQDNLITELWINNSVIDESEASFRTQVLGNIKAHFCRVFSDRTPVAEPTFNENGLGVSLVGKFGELAYSQIAMIEEFKAELVNDTK